MVRTNLLLVVTQTECVWPASGLLACTGRDSSDIAHQGTALGCYRFRRGGNMKLHFKEITGKELLANLKQDIVKFCIYVRFVRAY